MMENSAGGRRDRFFSATGISDGIVTGKVCFRREGTAQVIGRTHGDAAVELDRAERARKALLSSYREEEQRARENGARGYLPKDVDQARLAKAIREIAATEDSFECVEFQAAPSLLTTREMDVLRLVAQGNQRDQIAAALGIGAESVKTHLKGIMNKLGCPNATSAVGRAYELGILRA